MGEHSKEPVTWGAMRVVADGVGVGYQAFRAVRGATKSQSARTLVGPVRDTYTEAAQDARDAADSEKEGAGNVVDQAH